MKVAVIQFRAGKDKSKNLSKIIKLITRAAAQKARFIALPEVFLFRGKISAGTSVGKIAETIPGESLKVLMVVARKHKIFLLAGSMYEKKRNAKKVYNTSVLIDPRGGVKAKYRKINLFNAVLGKKRIRESELLLQGTRPVMTRVENLKVGLSICYDLRFTALYQKYRQLSVDLISIPSAFTKKTGRAHWETLVRARAIENLCYVLAPNQWGSDDRGIICYGHSLIVDPWGRVIARALGNKDQIVYANIDKKVIRQARLMLPGIAK